MHVKNPQLPIAIKSFIEMIIKMQISHCIFKWSRHQRHQHSQNQFWKQIVKKLNFYFIFSVIEENSKLTDNLSFNWIEQKMRMNWTEIRHMIVNWLFLLRNCLNIKWKFYTCWSLEGGTWLVNVFWEFLKDIDIWGSQKVLRELIGVCNLWTLPIKNPTLNFLHHRSTGVQKWY